jgi:hypothetical protein
MNENASVRNNRAYSIGTGTSGYGGGVAVGGASAIFTMRGSAVVSGNVASSDDGSGFGYGGGVYVDLNGALRIAGGTVYGSMANAPSSLANTAPSGASYYKAIGGTVSHGGSDGTQTTLGNPALEGSSDFTITGAGPTS